MNHKLVCSESIKDRYFQLFLCIQSVSLWKMKPILVRELQFYIEKRLGIFNRKQKTFEAIFVVCLVLITLRLFMAGIAVNMKQSSYFDWDHTLKVIAKSRGYDKYSLFFFATGTIFVLALWWQLNSVKPSLLTKWMHELVVVNWNRFNKNYRKIQQTKSSKINLLVKLYSLVNCIKFLRNTPNQIGLTEKLNHFPLMSKKVRLKIILTIVWQDFLINLTVLYFGKKL